jgi:hypothetical protein
MRKRTQSQYEILLFDEFYSIADGWTEHLCMEANPDGSIPLSSRAYEVIRQAGEMCRAKTSCWPTRTVQK